MSIFTHLLIDTNEFRYLDDLGFLDCCLDAVEYPMTLDLIRDIEMKKPCWKDVACHGVDVLTLDEKMMSDTVELMTKAKGLSIYDAGLIILGKVFRYPVFTEDRKMIRELSRLHLKHVSLPEVVESLVFQGYVSFKDGYNAVGIISSRLLPGRYDEVCDRLQERFSQSQ